MLLATERFEAELLAAELAAWQGRWHEADERLNRLAASAPDDARRARVAIAAMDNCLNVVARQLLDYGVTVAAEDEPHARSF